MSDDMKKLREEHWQKFVNEYIKPLDVKNFPVIEEHEGYNDFYIYRKSSKQKITPNIQQLSFIQGLLDAQNGKKKLIPYIWVWGLSFYTFNISDYCQKRLFKTLTLNGFEDYPGSKYGIKLLDNEFDDNIRDILDNPDLTGKEFCKVLMKFVDDYAIES